MSDRLYTQIADDGGPLLKRVYKENIMDTNEITFKKWPNHFSGNRRCSHVCASSLQACPCPSLIGCVDHVHPNRQHACATIIRY